ncbi:acyl-ACP thioesterase domain-containing protein [uncultured Croceitalea sp.]|uniref:acyl-CoA thioesterase n=1 Tax=uncultured Croceitalea sp. TaxID=1798908 RepID=UPI0033061A38
MQAYTITIKVQADDIDDLNHVNNVRYIDWIQKISKEHWQNVASAQMQQDFTWVVRKHQVTYHSAAKVNDNILLKTAIIGTKGPISVRMVEMRNNKTNQLLVTSETDWCLLDPKSMRPIRVPETIIELFNSN